MKKKLSSFIFIISSLCILIAFSTFGFKYTKSYHHINRFPEISKNLEKHVKHLSEEINHIDVRHPENLKKASDYIINEFESYGYIVEKQTYMIDKNTSVENIIARKNTAYSDEDIIIGAHYDTMNNPGADDNASGVAVLLELAKRLSTEESAKSVQFVAFTNEEPPFYHTEKMGSRVYVKNLKDKKRKIKTAIVLEMVGYYDDTLFSQTYPMILGFIFPNKGNYIAVVGNSQSSDVVEKIEQTMYNQTNLPVEKISSDLIAKYIDFSDHKSFWLESMPAVLITNTGFFRNPNYHKKTDTYKTLDYERMSELTKGLKLYIESHNK